MTEKKNAKKPKADTISSADFKKLNLWNKVAAGLFAVQAIVLVVVAKAVTVPVMINYLAVDKLATDAAHHEVLAPAYRQLFDVRMAWLLAAALLIFALGYIVMATIARKRYELDVAGGLNRWRWATIGIGGGTVLLAVAVLSGVQHLGLLLAIFLCSCLSGVLILLTERLVIREGEKPHMGHVLCATSVISALFPWVILLGGAAAAWMFGGKLPMYMYGVYATLLVLTVAIMGITHVRITGKDGKLKSSLYAERSYMILGVIGVSAVVWQIYLGALR